ncbi:large subunit ribosomal protein L4 [Thermotomaculum hydrothermale]|uniref:Large ribosomal subunit protein uL4 n=1 Tax=Thermotomaculum hydrothermale TaxID=981385 RepID=A0A7R6PFT0_9BACT|nr:50S ribosomal protein L4 [Thermotomaculum hydrothermale]BBB32929.1 large subunit ribosomal protein L4 [Thermotomaculum hydrothermale]
MAKVKVINLDNQVVDEVELNPSIFEVELNEHLVWEALNATLANRRVGTASAKNRKDVSGGGKKPWRQKGTGRARHGSIRSPLWVGGGTVHGPQPRDFSVKFPKKKRRKAVKMLLSDKLRNEKLVVVDKFEIEQPKTKLVYDKVIKGLNVDSGLLIDGNLNRNLYLSSRNIPRLKSLVATDLNVFDLMKYDYVLVSLDGLKKIEEVLG